MQETNVGIQLWQQCKVVKFVCFHLKAKTILFSDIPTEHLDWIYEPRSMGVLSDLLGIVPTLYLTSIRL